MNNKKIILKIIENWPVKALSIALALILFVFHRLNTMASRPLSVPLSIATSAALIPASPYPQQVRVTLRGEDGSIRSIADGDIEAFVDLTRYEAEGFYSAPVQVRKKGSAIDIEPLEISVSPLRISVSLDKRISRTLPLVAVIQGRAADGFDFVSHSTSPQEITITGPLASLESILEIKTEPVDLDSRSANFSIEVNIANPSPLFLIRGGGMAEVSCQIRPSVTVRSIEGIAIDIAGLADAFTADTGGRTGNIRIEGNQTLLDEFEPPPNLFTVDCSRISDIGTFTLPVAVNLPAGYSLLRREPEELALTIALKDIENEEDEQ